MNTTRACLAGGTPVSSAAASVPCKTDKPQKTKVPVRKYDVLGLGPSGFIELPDDIACKSAQEHVDIKSTTDTVFVDLLTFCHYHPDTDHNMDEQKAGPVAFIVELLFDDDQLVERCCADAVSTMQSHISGFTNAVRLVSDTHELVENIYQDMKGTIFNKTVNWLDTLDTSVVVGKLKKLDDTYVVCPPDLDNSAFLYRLGYMIRLCMFMTLRNYIVSNMVSRLLTLLLNALMKGFGDAPTQASFDKLVMGENAINAMYRCTHFISIYPSAACRKLLRTADDVCKYSEAYMARWDEHVDTARRNSIRIWNVKFLEVYSSLRLGKSLDAYERKYKRKFRTTKHHKPISAANFKWSPQDDISTFTCLPATLCCFLGLPEPYVIAEFAYYSHEDCELFTQCWKAPSLARHSNLDTIERRGEMSTDRKDIRAVRLTREFKGFAAMARASIDKTTLQGTAS